MLCNWCHKKISQGEEYREKSQGYGYWSTYRGTGRGSYNYEGGGYYHVECWRKYREWKQEWENKQWWISFWVKIWFVIGIAISIGLGVLFDSVRVGVIAVILLVILPSIAIYFWGKWKVSRTLKESTSQLKKIENKILTCRNCKQKYFDFYSQRESNEDYVFKQEPGYCSPCTHKLFYPETISKCKVCGDMIYVKDKDNKESPEICQDCYEEKENLEKIREKIKKEKQKKPKNNLNSSVK